MYLKSKRKIKYPHSLVHQPNVTAMRAGPAQSLSWGSVTWAITSCSPGCALQVAKPEFKLRHSDLGCRHPHSLLIAMPNAHPKVLDISVLYVEITGQIYDNVRLSRTTLNSIFGKYLFSFQLKILVLLFFCLGNKLEVSLCITHRRFIHSTPLHSTAFPSIHTSKVFEKDLFKEVLL